MKIDATYSPEDNKLRLHPATRLDRATYERVKAAGFIWAAKQECFVAAAWTPHRADLCEELAGEIGDEDKSLAERALERAERFDEYQDKRAADAERARAAVAAIADSIPLGQPILVGHHSERHARRDKERIDAGMRKTVRAWETAQYWKDRAAGALAHASYKGRPDVRARRIKSIEADQRRADKQKSGAMAWLQAWERPLTIEQARALANYCHVNVAETDGGLSWSAWDVLRPDGERYQKCPAWTVEQVQTFMSKHYPRVIANCERWLDHYANRLTYERAMLGESGYIEPPKRPTRATLPLLNYSGTVEYRSRYGNGDTIKSEAHGMTKAEFAAIHKDYKGTFTSADGTHRIRCAMAGTPGQRGLCAVYLTDAKQNTRPGSKAIETREEQETAARIEKARDTIERQTEARRRVAAHNRALITSERSATVVDREQTPADVQAMREALRNGGAQTVSAPQLFPTPPELARRMVKLAGIVSRHRVLEPSAGTGRLLDAVREHAPGAQVVAVEINGSLAGRLDASDRAVICGDFLRCERESIGAFDRVVMNPPFENASDIAHIRHALAMLKPGGRLVAICAGGPRQEAALRPMVEEYGGKWEPLPADTFDGTGVRTVLLTLDAPTQ